MDTVHPNAMAKLALLPGLWYRKYMLRPVAHCSRGCP